MGTQFLPVLRQAEEILFRFLVKLPMAALDFHEVVLELLSLSTSDLHFSRLSCFILHSVDSLLAIAACSLPGVSTVAPALSSPTSCSIILENKAGCSEMATEGPSIM